MLMNDPSKCFWVIFSVFLAAFIFATGCATMPQPDPLAGWNVLLGHDSENLDKAITQDYQSYIAALPKRESKQICLTWFLGDGRGDHAVKFEIALNGTDWTHVLFYDKNNRRMKVIKYVSGHYRC